MVWTLTLTTKNLYSLALVDNNQLTINKKNAQRQSTNIFISVNNDSHQVPLTTSVRYLTI